MNQIAEKINTLNKNDIESCWREFGAMGLYDIDKKSSVELCRRLVQNGCYCFPIWLQNDVIKLVIRESGYDGREELLHLLVTGEAIFCLAITESGGGSSFSNIETTVMPATGETYCATGRKKYITNGRFSDIVIFVARDNLNKLNLYLTRTLPKRGRSALRMDDSMKEYELSELTLDAASCECLFPNRSEKAMFTLSKALGIERFFCAITLFEMCKNVLSLLTDRMKHQRDVLKGGLKWRDLCADYRIRTELLRRYIEWAERTYLDHCAIMAKDAAVMKGYSSELLLEMLLQTELLYGAEALAEGNELEKLKTYARAYAFAGGTPEVMKKIIAADL